MAVVSYVSGVDEVLKNLRTSKILVEAGFERGLKRAGQYLQRQSQKVVPVDTGNLKGSAFTRSSFKGAATVVTVGYTAAYAIFVHERMELRHKPGKQAKYLEEPARRLRDKILQVIAEEAQL